MLQVTAAGTRAGSSARRLTRPPWRAARLSLQETQRPRRSRSASSLDVESPGDSSSRVGSSDGPARASAGCESPGDSEARGDSDGVGGRPGGTRLRRRGRADEPGRRASPPEPPPAGELAVGLELGDGLATSRRRSTASRWARSRVARVTGVGDGVVGATGGATPGGDGAAVLPGPAATTSPPNRRRARSGRRRRTTSRSTTPSSRPPTRVPSRRSTGEALTHGSLAGAPLTRQTNPGCRVA